MTGIALWQRLRARMDWPPALTASRIRDLAVAGKTGTAQVGKLYRNKPRIAFAVIIEHGGHGGAAAAPVAMEIVRGYFKAVEEKETGGRQPATRDRQPAAGSDGEGTP